MAKEPITLNTVEDLVTFTVRGYRWVTDNRWQLVDRDSQVWDNFEEGLAWEKEHDAWEESLGKDENGHKRYSFSDLTLEEREREREVQSRRPGKHNVTTYYLDKAGTSYHSDTIFLSEDLGAKIDAIWTKRLPYRNASYTQRIGTMTLQGMLKRLGADKGVAEQIEAAKAAEKAQSEKNRRNSDRRNIQKAAQELLDALHKSVGDDPKFSSMFDLWEPGLTTLVIEMGTDVEE